MTDSLNPRYAALAAGVAASVAVAAYLRRRQSAGPVAEGGAERLLRDIVPAHQGDAVGDVETPALLVDLDAAEANMRLLETQCAGFPGVVVRPHIKSHKCPKLAKLQLRHGATQGLCCAKVAEMEAMASAGILDLHLANEVVDSRKQERLCKLIRRTGAKVRPRAQPRRLRRSRASSPRSASAWTMQTTSPPGRPSRSAMASSWRWWSRSTRARTGAACRPRRRLPTWQRCASPPPALACERAPHGHTDERHARSWSTAPQP